MVILNDLIHAPYLASSRLALAADVLLGFLHLTSNRSHGIEHFDV